MRDKELLILNLTNELEKSNKNENKLLEENNELNFKIEDNDLLKNNLNDEIEKLNIISEK